MWLSRLISPFLNQAFEQFPVVVITGPRQAGKTSLVRRHFHHAQYVTFDIPREAELARLDFDRFVRECREPLIIDEVQYVPEIFRHLKIAVDRDRRPGRFVLTGSQDFSVMKGVSESLAGRAAVLQLSTLSFEEIQQTEGGRANVDSYCWRGGYPELWQRPDLDRDLWLGSYIATYLERDVRNTLNIGNLRDFDRLLRAAALRAGRIVSYSELARDVGISPNTAKSWLSVLQASQQIFLLEPYHSSAGKRLIKSPKLYFCDTGLLTYLLGFADWDSVTTSPAWGAVWENLVVNEVRKHYLNRGKRPAMWFWRTRQGEEVDLLIEIGPRQFFGIECKAAAIIDSRSTKGFAAMEDEYGENSLKKCAVVCRTSGPYPLREQSRWSAIPLGGPQGLAAWLG